MYETTVRGWGLVSELATQPFEVCAFMPPDRGKTEFRSSCLGGFDEHREAAAVGAGASLSRGCYGRYYYARLEHATVFTCEEA